MEIRDPRFIRRFRNALKKEPSGHRPWTLSVQYTVAAVTMNCNCIMTGTILSSLLGLALCEVRSEWCPAAEIRMGRARGHVKCFQSCKVFRERMTKSKHVVRMRRSRFAFRISHLDSFSSATCLALRPLTCSLNICDKNTKTEVSRYSCCRLLHVSQKKRKPTKHFHLVVSNMMSQRSH